MTQTDPTNLKESRSASPAGCSTTDLDTLAKQQGVNPDIDLKQLRGDFWPEQESMDDFLATLDRWRTPDLDENLDV